jgi:uncharacterized integral membrane protein
MRYLRWIFWILLFVVFFGFALKNTDSVVVRYVLGWEWHPPLALALFAFFAAGVVLGILAAMASLYRQHRELVQLRRELRARQAASQTPDAQPERPFL